MIGAMVHRLLVKVRSFVRLVALRGSTEVQVSSNAWLRQYGSGGGGGDDVEDRDVRWHPRCK